MSSTSWSNTTASCVTSVCWEPRPWAVGKRLQSISHAVAPPPCPPPCPVGRNFRSCCRLYKTSSHTSACEFMLFYFILYCANLFVYFKLHGCNCVCVCVRDSKHQELGKQVQACRSDRLRQDLEREIENLVKKMEEKGEQIAKVRRHQAQVSFILTLLTFIPHTLHCSTSSVAVYVIFAHLHFPFQ